MRCSGTWESLAALSMEELAAAAGVSRGTLYRLVPGKSALLQRLIEMYSPFEAIRLIISEHRADPPEVVFPLIGGAIVGLEGEGLGLMRAIFHEVTSGGAAVDGMGPLFESALGTMTAYIAGQMAEGRIRPMHPILALQAFVGPIFFHLMTRPMVERIVPLPMDAESAVASLVASGLAGLSTAPGRAA